MENKSQVEIFVIFEYLIIIDPSRVRVPIGPCDVMSLCFRHYYHSKKWYGNLQIHCQNVYVKILEYTFAH
jgi:hypothetical protein